MNLLLRLFPRAWRSRYGDEFETLLHDAPPSVLDVIDIVRAALDARISHRLVASGADTWDELDDVPATVRRVRIQNTPGLLASSPPGDAADRFFLGGTTGGW